MITYLSFAFQQTKYLNTPFTKCNPDANYTKRACLRHQQMRKIISKERVNNDVATVHWRTEGVLSERPIRGRSGSISLNPLVSATVILAMTPIFMQMVSSHAISMSMQIVLLLSSTKTISKMIPNVCHHVITHRFTKRAYSILEWTMG